MFPLVRTASTKPQISDHPFSVVKEGEAELNQSACQVILEAVHH